ncbi:membrane protein [Budvicia aquatica]|nr:membrane protein [Budvicia aquatica]
MQNQINQLKKTDVTIMDSLTQIVLGSTVAAAVVPARHQRCALLAGAVLGTLPDLDVIWFNLTGSDVITTVTWHRGPSHSLFVLGGLGWLLWLLLKRFNTPIRDAPKPWLIAIWLALLTHLLLDAFTVYGTQLLWPLQIPSTMWSTIYIIDPLYTLPLLLGVIVAWLKGTYKKPPNTNRWHSKWTARKWLMAGLMISSAYLSWSMVAKFSVNHIATRSLEQMGLANAPRFSTPTAFNTLLWRVIVMAPDGYYIGDRSLIADRGAMHFNFYPSNTEVLKQLSVAPELQRLLWFTHGFVSAHTQQQGNGQQRLIISDLRMGLEPDYFFRYNVASRDTQGSWIAAPSITQMSDTHNHAVMLTWVWHRLWGL